jgi:hypothetical protein
MEHLWHLKLTEIKKIVALCGSVQEVQYQMSCMALLHGLDTESFVILYNGIGIVTGYAKYSCFNVNISQSMLGKLECRWAMLAGSCTALNMVISVMVRC